MLSAVSGLTKQEAPSAAVALGPDRGATRISAGNYGGKLGPHHFRLLDLLP